MFETALGACALVWGPRGLARVHIAEPSPTRLARSLARELGAQAQERAGKAPGRVAARLRAHLSGNPQSFADVALDLGAATAFRRRVYQALRRVRAGQVVTYAELARRAGSGDAARAVGGAVAANPLPIVVPCHRVVGAGGKLGGFSAPGGVATKIRLLALEGVDPASL